ncbi:MAG: NAD(P)H-dependent oxidoreductase, partial [Spirochaetales bacterium]|nr:NAD(P)H-dependent oxidoreductase [Spirochaetales bacterium]
MRIAVMNGSPKGRESVTMQYVEYMARRFSNVEFEIHDVAREIHGLERDQQRFLQVIESVRAADGVLWAFPLYILLVCSQYKRFIELIEERGVVEAFSGRYAATLSTSINFYDSGAHSYMRGVCEDLRMPFAGFYSANMHDLMKPSERTRLDGFARELFQTIRRREAIPRLHAPLAAAEAPLHLPFSEGRQPLEGFRVLIVTDALPTQQRLKALVDRFVGAFAEPPEVANLHDLDIRGGCLGCLRCGAGFQCAYAGKDAFMEFYNGTVQKADVIVFAGAIAARQLSWKWRQFFDRSFFNTHTPSLVGKQIGFLVSGPLSQLPELRQVYEAWIEIQRSHLVDFVSDEGQAADVAARLDSLAARLVRLARSGYIRPRTFLGIGGMKVFRDDIWGGLRIVFRADHRAYRREGYYDFPQRRILRRLVIALAWVLTGLPGIRSRFYRMIRGGMVRPYARVLDRTESAADDPGEPLRPEAPAASRPDRARSRDGASSRRPGTGWSPGSRRAPARPDSRP